MEKLDEVLNREQIEDEVYKRQIIIEDFGKENQLKLKKSTAFVVGLGGLGSPAALYLTAAGIGRLIILDDDKVESSNLNRQILHWRSDIRRSKVKSASEKLLALNPGVELEEKEEELSSEALKEISEKVDVVVDGLDSFKDRYIVNKACVKTRTPFVHGGLRGFGGQLTTIVPGKGPCLRCSIPKEPPKEDEIPVLGATAGIIGCLEAMETIKMITGIGRTCIGRMIIFDGKRMEFDEINIKRNPDCPVCGKL